MIGVAVAIQQTWLSDEAARETFGAKIKKLEVDTRTEAVALAVKFSYLGAHGRG